MKGLTLVGQEAIPQRQRGAIPRNPQQENGTDGQTVSEKTLFTPRSSHHLRETEAKSCTSIQTRRNLLCTEKSSGDNTVFLYVSGCGF